MLAPASGTAGQSARVIDVRRFWHCRFCDCQERLNSVMLEKALQFFGSVMSELQYNRRSFTAGLASLLLCPGSLDFSDAQQLERSSLKVWISNKANLYYLPVT